MPGSPIDVQLAPGEHFVGDARHRVHTLLGSCVSITLWHPGRRIGAISHFLLAQRGASAPLLDARYGNEALALMVRDLALRGVEAADCEAHIFGGADMFPGNRSSLHVGRRNGETAHALLAQRGITVAGNCLYGHQHRRILFDIASGEVRSLRPQVPA